MAFQSLSRDSGYGGSKPKNEELRDFDRLYKIVIVGDAAVGKTNMLAYYKDGAPVTPSTVSAVAEPVESFKLNRKPTIGVEFYSKYFTHPNGTVIKAQIWDTAGQERYRAITNS
jgi:Ras-related protein Rab-11A